MSDSLSGSLNKHSPNPSVPKVGLMDFTEILEYNNKNYMPWDSKKKKKRI